MASAVASAMLAGCGGGRDETAMDRALTMTHPWMSKEITPEERAKLLVAAMTLEQKQQQLVGSTPEIIPDPELPHCFGARHVTGIAALEIPALRITNGPVGIGQNDCSRLVVTKDLTDPARPL